MDAWRRTLFWSYVAVSGACLLWYKRVVLTIAPDHRTPFLVACALGFAAVAFWMDYGKRRVRTSTLLVVAMGAAAVATGLAPVLGSGRLPALALAGAAIGAAFFHLQLTGLRALPQNRRGLAFAAVFMAAGAVNTTTDMRTVPFLYVDGIGPNCTMACLALVAGAAVALAARRAFDVTVVPVTAGRLGSVGQIAGVGLAAAASFVLLYASLGLQESIAYPEAVTRAGASELVRYVELPLFLAAGLVADKVGRQALAMAALVGALIGAAEFLAPVSTALTAVAALGVVFALTAYPVACVALIADASCYARRPALLGCLAFAPVVVGHLVASQVLPHAAALGGTGLFLADVAVLVAFAAAAAVLNELVRTNFTALKDSTLLVEVPQTPAAEPDLAAVAKRFGLTRREQEILELSLEGLTVPQMAERLFVTETTIKFHVTNLLRKTGTGSRAELAAELGG